MADPEIAKRGYSRDHRPDCVQVNIALVVTREGMPLGYEIFPGNSTDVITVQKIVSGYRSDWADWARLTEAVYILRTNVTAWTDEALWRTYIQLTEAEAAFRIHKSDLAIRPIWHHKQGRIKAHILICFIAYALWKTLQQWQSKAGLGHAPRTILTEFSRIHAADIVSGRTEMNQWAKVVKDSGAKVDSSNYTLKRRSPQAQ